MTKETALQLFEQKLVRSLWNEEEEKWYFSIVDVVAVLTDSINPTDYLKKIRKRDAELGSYIGTNCPQIAMLINGKKRKTLAGSTKDIFRIIQSIPSPKAEPFKLWLAQVGSERLDEMQDPEIGIDRALQHYLQLGYSESWINQRLKSIDIRKELTDEWKSKGLKEGTQFAILTNIITKAWSEKTTKEYKVLKGLKKENLRDNMSNTELILNMLAEASTKDISQAVNPKNFKESQKVAKQGGNVAKVALKELEAKTGRKVVTSISAKTLLENNKREE